MALAGCSLSDARPAREGPTLTTASRKPRLTPPAAWLGINYNSSSAGAQLQAFSDLGIVYDRDGGLETTAGQLASTGSTFGRALTRSYGAGMVPDVLVDPDRGVTGCEQNPNSEKLCLPSTSADVDDYVTGFIATMRSVLKAHPGRRVLFEPMDEPWNWGSPPGTRSGRRPAAEYATVLADILQQTARAGMSLRRIYVPTDGTLDDGTSWISDLYAARPCLKPGAHSCGPIEGWNVHPYGRPGVTSEGIDSVPGLRAQMLSGMDNVIVSEIGFCADNVDQGAECDENQSDVDSSSAQTADWLTRTLHEAARMHRAGWLKALIVWDRAQGGWGMQTADGRLTAQGSALEAFARSRAGHSSAHPRVLRARRR
jgi:hypothetical protein